MTEHEKRIREASNFALDNEWSYLVVENNDLRALLADLDAMRGALLKIARMAEDLKKPCSMDADSPQAIRNGQYMNICYAAHAALSEAKAGGWQPIETAPKDELIVIYQPRFKRVTTAINDGFDWVHATHWQPLPAPPAQRGEG